MSPERTCPDCGSPLPADAPRGLCPRCLMGAALSGPSTTESAAKGVLDTIAQSIGPVPHVLLRDTGRGEEPGPIVRPQTAAEDYGSTRYRIDGEIARGGMGTVLKGRDPDLGRDIALKVLRDDFRDNANMVRRFVEEAQIGGQLQHPGVVPIYELGAFADQRPFFSMKLVKGHTLAELLEARKDRADDLPRFLGIFEAVCQTMAYAHTRGVIHRDLKPSNVMVGNFGEVQVMDWGLAKVLPRGGIVDDAAAGKIPEETIIATARSGSDSDPDLSRAGSIMGTPSYMAPEQARGEVNRVDERADVFALGSILAQILTGEPAFIGRSAGEIQRNAALGDTAGALARLDSSGADLELILVAKDCLARECLDRPRDAAAVAQRITHYLAGVQDRMRRAELVGVEERARRRLTTVVAASLLVLTTAGGLGLTYWLQQRQAVTARVALALKEATLLRNQAVENPDDPARWPAALEGLKRAEAALAEGGDPAALEQLAALTDEVQAGAEAAERDHDLLAKLVDIRSAKADDPDGSTTDAAYADAFRGAGFDIEGLDPKQTGGQIAGRPEPVRLALVAALDHWTLVRKERRTRGRGWPKLVAVARSADPDPDRDALRAALEVAGRGQRLEQVRPLAERANAQTWSPTSLVLLASTLADAGDVEAGVAVLRRAAGAHPTDVWVHYTLGGMLQKTNPPRQAEAIEAYAAARALQPELAHELAHALVFFGRNGEGEAVFRDLVKRRPTSSRHVGCLALHLRETGRSDEAAAILEQAVVVARKEIQLRPRDAEAHNAFGFILLNGPRDYPAAEAVLGEAIRLNPELANAHRNLGTVLQGLGRLDESIAAFREVIRLEPDRAEDHYRLGDSLRRRSQMDEALAEFHAAIRLQSDHAAAHFGLGDVLLATGRLAEAEAEYRLALAPYQKLAEASPMNTSLQGNVANCHSAIGNALSLAGKPAEALERFQLALAIRQKLVDETPADADFRTGLADIHDGLGHFWLETGKVAEAVQAFESAVAILRDLAKADSIGTLVQVQLANSEHNLGVALHRAGKPVEAIRAYETALALQQKIGDADTTDPQKQSQLAGILSDLGSALRATGKSDEALRALESARALQQQVADANPAVTQYQKFLAIHHAELGALLSATGNPADALQAYETALVIQQKLADANPTIPQYQSDLAARHHELGMLQASIGKTAEAIKAYQSAVAVQQRVAEAYPAVRPYQVFLANHLRNLGILLTADGKPDEALRAFESARAIDQRLADANPLDTESQSHLALNLGHLGRLMAATGKPDEALRLLESALAINQTLADAHPAVTEFQRSLVQNKGILAGVLVGSGRVAEAIEMLQSSLAILMKLAAEQPDAPDLASEVGAILNDLAAADLSMMRYEEARARIREAIAWQSKALAMNPANPQYRLLMEFHVNNLIAVGHLLDDSDSLAEAERAMATIRDSDPATAAVDLRLTAVIKGEQQPRDDADRLVLAQRAFDKALYATSARLFAEAFANDPRVGDEVQRYYGQCAAALAGCGKGKDDPAIDEATKTALRQQALNGLKSDLANWTLVLAGGDEQQRAFVVQMLRHWKIDPDLAVVRNPEALATLPEAERERWNAMWAEVDELLAKAVEQPDKVYP